MQNDAKTQLLLEVAVSFHSADVTAITYSTVFNLLYLMLFLPIHSLSLRPPPPLLVTVSDSDVATAHIYTYSVSGYAQYFMYSMYRLLEKLFNHQHHHHH